jgi:hypothetical protein
MFLSYIKDQYEKGTLWNTLLHPVRVPFQNRVIAYANIINALATVTNVDIGGIKRTFN